MLIIARDIPIISDIIPRLSDTIPSMYDAIPSLFYIFLNISMLSITLTYNNPSPSQALRLDVGCHQMMMPAMQLVRTLNAYCCVVDRTHHSKAGSYEAGVSFPEIQFPGTVDQICCSYRG